MVLISRYIGFDMDECIGNVHPLHPFTNEFLTRNPADAAFVQRVVQAYTECERKRRIGFLRSGIIPVMKAVYQAYKAGKITGAFVFSNNSNHSLVEFIRRVMECIVQQEYDLKEPPGMFKMAISFQSPERGPPTAIKDWAAVTRSLSHHHLPLPTSHSDLLFFDDKKHVLTSQIPHYTVVPAYHYESEYSEFARCVHSLVPAALKSRWDSLLSRHVQTRAHTPERVPTTDEGETVFLSAIRRFVSPTSRTLKTKRKRRGTRKNRRRHK